MPAELTEAAFAKVNLYLHVLGRRADGYHLLDSLVAFADVGDELSAVEADELSLTVEGPFAAGLAAETDNLIVRAARSLASAAGCVPRARMTLRKNLPVASGIGGGSADAAATLRVLCRLWRIAPEPDALARLAGGLGADVPVCLAGRPARMTGIGEVLLPAPRLPECGLVLVNPGVPVATSAVFRARHGDWSASAALPPAWPDATAMAASLATCRNDLQPSAATLEPAIGDVLAALTNVPGCLLARMSGSGATCFGLFATGGAAAQAAGDLRHPGWWSWGGRLRRA